MSVLAAAADLGLVKSGFDILRGAIGLFKDVQSTLPASPQKEAIEVSLAEADQQVRIAEAQIAKGLGYKLCQCAFPPTIMLSVGYQIARNSGAKTSIFECAICKTNDASAGAWTRNSGEKEEVKKPGISQAAVDAIGPARRPRGPNS
jgi:hypothetical protein